MSRPSSAPAPAPSAKSPSPSEAASVLGLAQALQSKGRLGDGARPSPPLRRGGRSVDDATERASARLICGALIPSTACERPPHSASRRCVPSSRADRRRSSPRASLRRRRRASTRCEPRSAGPTSTSSVSSCDTSTRSQRAPHSRARPSVPSLRPRCCRRRRGPRRKTTRVPPHASSTPIFRRPARLSPHGSQAKPPPPPPTPLPRGQPLQRDRHSPPPCPPRLPLRPRCLQPSLASQPRAAASTPWRDQPPGRQAPHSATSFRVGRHLGELVGGAPGGGGAGRGAAGVATIARGELRRLEVPSELMSSLDFSGADSP